MTVTVLEPVNPLVEEGQTLELLCSITDTYNGSYVNQSQKIYFMSPGIKPNVTRYRGRPVSPRSAKLVIQSIRLDQGGHYYCCLPDRRDKQIGLYAASATNVVVASKLHSDCGLLNVSQLRKL